MGQKKQPSPMSEPIARLRAAGARVAFGDSHNPSASLDYSRLHYRVTLPDGSVREIRERGSHYRLAIARLDDLTRRLNEQKG